jgi:diguanylate cyclase (GGDEF)-like protein
MHVSVKAHLHDENFFGGYDVKQRRYHIVPDTPSGIAANEVLSPQGGRVANGKTRRFRFLAHAMQCRMLLTGWCSYSYLYVTIYFLCMTVLRFAYAGDRRDFFWPSPQKLESDLILGLMLLFCCVGLQVGGGFLSLTTQIPVLKRLVHGFSFTCLALLGWCVVIGNEQGIALAVFIFMSLFMLCMVALGIRKARRGGASERFFLAAAVCGMFGAGFSTFVLMNFLPFTSLTYRTLEFVALLEVTLLALALGYQTRQQQQARILAEQMAGRDSLTDLYNRRAFLELAKPIWSIAQRKQRPLAMIMLDVDHFKQVNDQFGHEVGDRALVQTANLLSLVCRAGDLLSRWGGEEFLLLLPETDLEQACTFAERVRSSLAALGLPIESESIFLTASLGVAERGQKSSLEDLIKAADMQLYDAKRCGRNRYASEGAVLTKAIFCAQREAENL